MNLLERALAWMNGPQTAPSGIDRRKFLAILGGTAVGAAVAPLIDVEKLLWTPRVMIYGSDTMTWLTPDWVTREALKILENNLTVVGTFDRYYDNQFRRGHKIGHTVNVRKPPKWGTSMLMENHPVVLTDQHSVEIELPSEEVQVNRRTFTEQVIRPAVEVIRAKLPEGPVYGELELPVQCGASGLEIDSARATSPDGPSIRAIKGTGYNVVEDRMFRKLRLDVLVGKA